MSKQHVLLVQDKLYDALDEFHFASDTPLADKFEVMSHLFLEQAARALADMSAKDAMIAAGISVDKMQLLRGLPTEIKDSMPLLVQLVLRLAAENVELKTFLSKTLKALDE